MRETERDTHTDRYPQKTQGERGEGMRGRSERDRERHTHRQIHTVNTEREGVRGRSERDRERHT